MNLTSSLNILDSTLVDLLDLNTNVDLQLSPCSEVEQRYDDVYFCRSYSENDYSQVWVLAGASILIGLGITLAQFSELAKYITLLDKIRRAVTNDTDIDIGDKEDIDTSNVGGYSISQYIILQAGLVLIYFIAKILVMTDTSIFDDVSDANKSFNNNSFRKWFNSMNILTVMVLSASTTASQGVLKLVGKVIKQGDGNDMSIISLLACIVFIMDIIGTFVMLCVKYGYLVISAYVTAVGLLVCLMLAVSVCCWAPCILCIQVMLSKVFETIFGCGSEKCKKLLSSLAGAICLFFVIYLMIVAMYLFAWLFLGGPIDEHIAIVDEGNQVMVFECLLAAAIYGFIVMIGGFIRTVMID